MKTKTTHQILAGVAILFMLLTVRPALAAEWVFCESNRSGHLYYDKTSIDENRGYCPGANDDNFQ